MSSLPLITDMRMPWKKGAVEGGRDGGTEKGILVTV